MSIGVGEASSSLRTTILSPLKTGNSNLKELVHTLSSEVIAGAYLFKHGPNGPGFQPARNFCMARKILESIETIPSLHVAQTVIEMAASENSHELIALRAKLADEVVIAFSY